MDGLVQVCPGHPRFSRTATSKTRMPATRAGMTPTNYGHHGGESNAITTTVHA
jgi:hypothetical protein